MTNLLLMVSFVTIIVVNTNGKDNSMDAKKIIKSIKLLTDSKNQEKVDERIKHALKHNQSSTLSNTLDSLLDKNKRILHGDFWTPKQWVILADKKMKKTIGSNFHNQALIWDCACGTGNLTAPFSDYTDLYCSTLLKRELNVGIVTGKFRNTNHIFSYDFLNNLTLPTTLTRDILYHKKNNLPVVFYTNPPYGTANNLKSKKFNKIGIAKNKVNGLMKNTKLGRASQQMYAQFYYRAYLIIKHFHLTNAYICFFSQPQFLTGGSYWKKFNDKVLSHFIVKDGFIVPSGTFSGTNNKWPVGFLVMKYHSKSIPFAKKHTIEKYNLSNDKVIQQGIHTFLQVQNQSSLSKFIRQSNPNKDIPQQKAPELSSGLKINHGRNPKGKFYQNSLGYLFIAGNNVEDSAKSVWLSSATSYLAHGVNIMPTWKSLSIAVATFTIRRVVGRPLWYNALDNFHRPTINYSSSTFQHFCADALVYALFDSKSQQTSLRIKGYSNSRHRNCWINKWFWISYQKAKIMTLMYLKQNHIKWNKAKNDLKNEYQDNFVINMLRKKKSLMSKEAKLVLRDATDIYLGSFPYRRNYSKRHPKAYLYTWDAGWYQIRKMLKNKDIKKQYQYNYNLVDNIKRFNSDFDKLKKQLRRQVFELGCLQN